MNPKQMKQMERQMKKMGMKMEDKIGRASCRERV